MRCPECGERVGPAKFYEHVRVHCDKVSDGLRTALISALADLAEARKHSVALKAPTDWRKHDGGW